MFKKIDRLKSIIENEDLNFLINVIKKDLKRFLFQRYQYNKYKDNYIQNVIFIAGFAKSGTTWFTNMLASLKGFYIYTPKEWTINSMEIYDGMFNEFKNKLAIIKGHTWATKKSIENLHNQLNGKYFIVVRDPRDAIISAYWYIRRYPNHWDYKTVSSLNLKDYISYKLESGEYKTQLLDWLDGWYKKRSKDNSMIVKYEDLSTNTYDTMQKVLNFLDIKISNSELLNIIESNSFEKVTGRKRGEEKIDSFARKGIINEWKEVFTYEQKELANKISKEILLKYGYI